MDIFSAISDPTRRKILEHLSTSNNLTASDIYKKFNQSPPSISQHLKILREANLVLMKKSSQHRIYYLNPRAILEIENWLKKLFNKST